MAGLSLEGQVVLITGASQGAGRVMAREYAAAGARLVVAARRIDLLEELASEIRAGGGECLPVRADITIEQDCVDLVANAVARFGRLDVLINNAAIPGKDLLIAEQTLENWNQTIATDLTAPMLLSREALKQAMITQGSGAIQILSSQAARRGIPRKSHYVAAKIGQWGLTKVLAKEAGQHGVRVHCLVIGGIAGDLYENWMKRIASEQNRDPEELKRAAQAGVPFPRLVTPLEIARVSMFLASEGGNPLTGQMIDVANGSELK
jgi:NAD(P)-dependent dehydrogenase (short-subunit alcohol dehydrogenase family)